MGEKGKTLLINSGQIKALYGEIYSVEGADKIFNLLICEQTISILISAIFQNLNKSIKSKEIE